jgi:hypothetical protein
VDSYHKKETKVEGPVKYLVQVQCQPSPIGHEEQIFRAFRDSFNVSKCHCTGAGLTLELRYNHPLAYGVFKDLADLVIQTLIERNLRLLSGVIHRVERKRLSAVVDAFSLGASDHVKGTRKGSISFLSGGPLPKFVDGIHQVLGGTRLVPVMYFYREVFIDLMLSAKARRWSRPTAVEPN